jgi:subtilisin
MSKLRRPLGFTILLLSCLAVVLLVSVPAMAQSNGAERKIVVFQDWYGDAAAQAALLRAHGAQPIEALGLVKGMAAMLPPGVEKQLAARPEVRRVDVDAEVRALASIRAKGGRHNAVQPAQQRPWGVDRIDAEWAWDTSRGAGVNVAVIDTGIDATHPDLADNVAGGANFVRKVWWQGPDSSKWADDNGHGTHVAGIIAAEDNDIGVVGVAPEASLYAVKVLAKNGSGYISDIILGIEWAVDNGMDVANMSLGTNTDVQSFHDACDDAADAGLILVAAAGNDGGAVDYPGAYSSVIAVAATDISDQRASWSSVGPQVLLAAPGVSVLSTWKGGGYATASGTSMAAPHVTGTIALNLSADLTASADDLPPTGRDNYTGYGLVDAGEAVTGIPNYGDDLP